MQRSPNNPDKGHRNGSCNVTACQGPGATFFNQSTRAWYCPKCASEINDFKPTQEDSMKLYGRPELCITSKVYDALTLDLKPNLKGPL